MFKKWWVILIQGILMVILGIIIFNNPEEALAGISLWLGILITLTGLTGILGWIFAGKEHRETGSLIWSIISLLVGLYTLMNLLAAMKAITIIFGVWVLFTGFSLIKSGWTLKNETIIGWIILVVGIFSLIAGLMMIFNLGAGAEGVSFILGLQVIAAGIALMLFSFVKKSVKNKIEDKIKSIKN